MITVACPAADKCEIEECHHRSKHFASLSCTAPCSEYWEARCQVTMPDCQFLTGLWERKARGESIA